MSGTSPRRPAPAALVRGARDVDVPAIERIVHAAFARYADRLPRPPAPVLADYRTVVSARGARVALVEDRVAGVLVLWPHPDHVLLETVTVDPAAEGCGIGSLLLGAAEQEAREAGVGAVRLCTNAAMTENLAWYPRRGYAETGRRTEQGYERVFFEKRLPR